MAATVTLMQLLMLLARALRVSQRVSEMSVRRVQGGAKGEQPNKPPLTHQQEQQ